MNIVNNTFTSNLSIFGLNNKFTLKQMKTINNLFSQIENNTYGLFECSFNIWKNNIFPLNLSPSLIKTAS